MPVPFFRLGPRLRRGRGGRGPGLGPPAQRRAAGHEGDGRYGRRRRAVLQPVAAAKVFGGSLNGNYPDPKCPPQLNVEHLDLAVRYALGLPGVATLNIGVHNVEQLRKNVEMVRRYQPLTADEQATCVALGKKLSTLWGQHLGPLTRVGHLRGTTA